MRPARGALGWILLSSLLSAVAVAAGCSKSCPRPTLPQGPERPILWEVSGPKGRVWIFGTFHGSGADDVPPEAWPRLDASPLYVMETDTDQEDPELVLRLGFLPRGESLMRMLPDDVWFELREQLRGTVKEELLLHMRPWMAMSVFTAKVAKLPPQTMDVALRRRAEKRGKKIEFLEDWKDQMVLIDGAVTVDDLVQAVRDADAMPCRIETARRSYRAGDVDSIAQELDEERSAMLITLRNEEWTERIERYLEAGGAFVAVGAGHLAGPEGLPALLEAKGYRVRRVDRGEGL